MKKLLVLALVLGMATMASATPTMWFGTSASSSTAISSMAIPDASATVTLYLYGSSDIPAIWDDDTQSFDLGGGLDLLQFTAAFNSSKISVFSTTTNSTILGSSSFMGGIFGRSMDDTEAGNQLLKGAYATAAGAFQDAFTPTLLATLKFKEGAAPSATTISLYQGTIEARQTFFESADDSGNPSTRYYPAATFSIIPEPMTMALLGLGGLFLRRRSK